MSNINDHIVGYLDYYLNLENAPEYAVLLRGDWGSGKSFFAKNYLEQHPEHKYLRVSLYGITAFKEIEDSFFQQIHPILGSKAAKITSKLVTSVIKGTLKIDLNGDAKGGDVTAAISIPEFVTNFDKEAENRVLVFDDLERCNIKLTDLLGYINQYVEIYGLKVILIANEQEIIKKTKEAGEKEVSEYARVKEKLVGKSFDIQSDVDTALNVFIEQVRKEPGGGVMFKLRHVLKSTYEIAGYNNLRHLKQSVLDFARFYDFLPKGLDKVPGLLEHILSLFFAISIEVKKGDIQADEIRNIFLIDSMARARDQAPNAVQRIIAKYPVLGMYHQPFDPAFLVEFFKDGMVNKTGIENSINYSIYFEEDRKAAWVRLWYFDTLEDQDLEKNFTEQWALFENKKIADKYVLLHLVGIFLNLSKLGLINKDEKTIVTYAKANLDELSATGKMVMVKHDKLNTSAAYNLAYQSKSNPVFHDFVALFIVAARDASVSDLPGKAAELLAILKDNDSLFIVRVTLTNSLDNLYYDIPILAYIPVEDFVDAFMKLPNKKKNPFLESLQSRYELSNFKHQLQPEIGWWKKVLSKFKDIAPRYTGKVTGYILESSIRKIEGFIKLLEPQQE